VFVRNKKSEDLLGDTDRRRVEGYPGGGRKKVHISGSGGRGITLTTTGTLSASREKMPSYAKKKRENRYGELMDLGSKHEGDERDRRWDAGALIPDLPERTRGNRDGCSRQRS